MKGTQKSAKRATGRLLGIHGIRDQRANTASTSAAASRCIVGVQVAD